MLYVLHAVQSNLAQNHIQITLRLHIAITKMSCVIGKKLSNYICLIVYDESSPKNDQSF